MAHGDRAGPVAPAAIVVRTPRLELRWPSQDDLVALAALAGEGVHDERGHAVHDPVDPGHARGAGPQRVAVELADGG